jgi:hypothetical protein
MTRPITPTPLYAVIGATDLVVERLRTTAAAVDPPQQLVAELRSLPDRAQSAAIDALVQAVDAYSGLAQRGEHLVTRVRRQPSTQDTVAHAQATQSQAEDTAATARKQAKATTATARRSTKSTATTATDSAKKATRATTSRAKATATSAQKTAESAAKAASDAAGKVGD